MSLSSRMRKSAIPRVAAIAAAAILATSPAFANSPPQVAVAGAGAQMVIGNPVNFSGIAKDPQGIKQIYGSIQYQSNKKYLAPNGKLSSDPERLKFKFTNSQATRWVSQSFNLPDGNYTFFIRVEDGAKAISPLMKVPFTVKDGAPSAAALAQQAQRRPQRQTQQVAKPTVVAPAAAPAATAAVQTAAVAGAKAGNGMSYCANTGMDADGDGFGWQNNASCVVAGSKADTHPTCASSNSDPDGDGYGWENEKSCIVVTHCASAGSDADGDGFGWENNRSCIVLKKTNNTRFPTCAAGAASDPDGDGYGWENNATCVVAK